MEGQEISNTFYCPWIQEGYFYHSLKSSYFLDENGKKNHSIKKKSIRKKLDWEKSLFTLG